ncbi:hypothetical protein GCM10011376_34820 [Nocardioides flavus (ex Wang et al. 2016)]|uniref:Endonuclease G n=1 Tax=Nocardioides flavus (ex Wang et al. 2016) TaxID=2058780 RepID=A0ABQ3HR00_9ACTN|nr:DNA/RNA non-specific endonuclease [Nocardioides flavus (ex Wang et al. 2016)]GHE18872.1 hypothetical protein GCM10011376_34820 [Nocardioides flavus (ex Wang et al. 2016)]
MAATGYDPAFLDVPLAAPQAPGGSLVLDYTHFTLQMHPTRRLASWVTWNVDGLTLFSGDSISRSGERFRADPRLPESEQTLDEAYDGNELDRGHVARRSDLLWGTLADARQASSDSFFFTNITPQHQDFNQSGRGGAWGLLENAVLALEGLEDRRLSLFAGPVLREEDPVYRGIVQLPREHWKVVVYRVDGEPRFRCFVLSQDLDGIARIDFLEEFDTYLVPLAMLEERTGLTFDSLRTLTTAGRRGVEAPTLVTDAEQVAW